MMQTEKRVKVVLIGAGSNSFGPKMVLDIFSNDDLKKLKLDLALVDLNEENLEMCSRFAEKVAAAAGHDVRLSRSTNRLEALPGADYVIVSIARRRSDLWDLDFRVPLALGFKHVLGENGGPGSLFHALRSMDLQLPIARDMEKVCPHAWMLSYTNPMNPLCLALNRLTKIQAAGLCHGVMEGREDVAKILERDPREIEVSYGGINHFYWFTRIADAATGEDLHPELRRRVTENPEWLSTLSRTLWDVFGLLPFPRDNHIGEYLSFAHEITGFFRLGKSEAPCTEMPEPVRATDNPGAGSVKSQWAKVLPYIDGEKDVSLILKKSFEIATNLIADIELDLGRREPAVNILNRDGIVENLPRDGIVETAVTVDRQGMHPVRVGRLPTAIAELCRRQMAVQDVLVEAYAQRSRHLLLQALLLDPHVDSIDRARKLIDTMFELQGDFLPEME